MTGRDASTWALVASLAAVAAASAGCAGDEVLAPVGSASAIPTTPPTAPPDAGPPKRTVLQRNPFGDVAETDNLLFDGDFEWSSPFSDEYGWFQGQSPTVTDVVIGPDCRSGIKCARLAAHQSMVGIGVASKGTELEVSVWVHFDDPSTPCSSAKVTLIDRFAGSGGPLTAGDPDVHLVAGDPDQGGWCRLEGVSPPRANRSFLNVLNTSAGKMLVDDAVLKRLAGSSPAPAPPKSGVAGSPPAPPALPGPIDAWVPTAEESSDLVRVRALLAEWAKPHDGRPNEAQRAFERLHERGAP